MITSLNLFSQDDCYSEDDTYSSSLAIDCADRENYSPINSDYIPIKYVRVALHVMQKEDGSGNFTSSDLSIIYEIFDYVNDIYADLDAVSPGTSAYIPDSRVQFVLEEENIFFWQDDEDWDWSCGLCGTKADDMLDKYVTTNVGMPDIIKNNTLNIFWGGNYSGVVGAATTGYKTWLYQTSPYNAYTAGGDGPEKVKRNLIHELGHSLGLNHNFDTQCDECSDNDGSIDPCPDKGTSNNIMDYWPGTRSACSECQLKKIHWSLMGYNHNINLALIDDYCEIIDPEMVVDDPGNTVEWNYSVYLKGNLRITPTTTLVIKCLVGMPADGKIIVENGAKLVVDEGYITNMCGELWQGIEVWGVGSSYPHPSVSAIYGDTYPTHLTQHHGVVYIMDGSTIEYARNAITTSKYDDFGNAAYRGGIIVAHGANFINCKRSSEFMQYDYSPAQTDDDNISEFYRCNFEVNDNYPCSETFNAHITMWDIDGVDIIGCTFKDLRNACTNSGEGIYSIDATYTVASDLCGGAIPCDEHITTFERLVRAIHAENANSRPRDIVVSDVVFTNNYRGILFSNVDHSLVMNNTFEVQDQSSLNCYGMYLEDSKNYHIENNNFTTYGSYDGSSPYNGGIYVVNNSNSQTEIYRNYFEDLEAGIRVQNNNSALQIKCNTFNSEIDKHNIYVTNTGSLGTQGYCSPTYFPSSVKVTTPSGNTFSYDCNNSTGDIKVYNGFGILQYKHFSNTGHAPTCYTTGATTYVDPIDCGYSSPLDGYYACESKLPSGGSGFKLAETNEITGGELMNQVYDLDEAISGLIELINSEEYELEYLEEENTYNVDLNYLQDERERILYTAVNYYVLDNNIDSAFLVIAGENTDHSHQTATEIYLLDNDFLNAELEVEKVSNDNINASDFKALYRVLIANAKNGNDILDFTEVEVEQLVSLAGKQSPSGVAAENIIYFLTGNDYEEVFDNDEEIIEGKSAMLNESKIQVYPNPNTGEIFVDCTNFNSQDCIIFIYDLTGTLLFSYVLDSNVINKIDINSIPNGLFIAQIKSLGKEVDSFKIVKE